MLEAFYVQRGKKKYACTGTSVYQPGGKCPKTVNEYLGVLDEEAGKIIPKKNRGSTDKILDDDSLIGRRSGGSYVLLSIAERIGLCEDLFRHTPQRSRSSPVPSRRRLLEVCYHPPRTRSTAVSGTHKPKKRATSALELSKRPSKPGFVRYSLTQAMVPIGTDLLVFGSRTNVLGRNSFVVTD